MKILDTEIDIIAIITIISFFMSIYMIISGWKNSAALNEILKKLEYKNI